MFVTFLYPFAILYRCLRPSCFFFFDLIVCLDPSTSAPPHKHSYLRMQLVSCCFCILFTEPTKVACVLIARGPMQWGQSKRHFAFGKLKCKNKIKIQKYRNWKQKTCVLFKCSHIIILACVGKNDPSPREIGKMVRR